MPDKQWYTNKELFEEITKINNELYDKMAILEKSLVQTNYTIQKYNGLYKKVMDVEMTANENGRKISNMESIQRGRNSVGEAVKSWGGWIFGLISILIVIFQLFI